jgi:hypothetical protein
MTVFVVGRKTTRWSLTLNRPGKHNALSAELVEARIGAGLSATRIVMRVCCGGKR